MLHEHALQAIGKPVRLYRRDGSARHPITATLIEVVNERHAMVKPSAHGREERVRLSDLQIDPGKTPELAHLKLGRNHQRLQVTLPSDPQATSLTVTDPPIYQEMKTTQESPPMDNIKPRKPRKKEVKGKFFLMHTVEHAYWGGAAKGFVKAAPDAHGFPSQGRAIGSLKRLANSTRPIAGLTGRFKAQELILLNEDQVLSLYLAQDPTRVFADIAVQCRVSGEECCDAMKLKERAQDGSEHLTRLGVAEARYVAAKIKVQEAQARKQEAEAEFEQAAENRLRQLQSIRRELAAELDGVLEEIAEIES